MPDQEVVVIKLNIAGEETWRYSGRILERSENRVLLEAFFNRDDMPFHGMVFARGDRFLETYFSDRWYNIYEIHNPQTGALKGWYCNISRPALFEEGRISYVDLALDLLVYPDKSRLVLDEDEFDKLQIDDATRQKALAALQELQNQFQ